jgi:hypothetical protein
VFHQTVFVGVRVLGGLFGCYCHRAIRFRFDGIRHIETVVAAQFDGHIFID